MQSAGLDTLRLSGKVQQAENLKKTKYSSQSWPNVLFHLKHFNRFREFLYSSSSEVFPKRDSSPPRDQGFCTPLTSLLKERLSPPKTSCPGWPQKMQTRCYRGSNTQGEGRVLEGQNFGKNRLPWCHHFARLIKLIIIVNNKIQNSLVLTTSI